MKRTGTTKIDKKLIQTYRAIANFYADSYIPLISNPKIIESCIVVDFIPGFNSVTKDKRVFVYHNHAQKDFNLKFDVPKGMKADGKLLQGLLSVNILTKIQYVIKKDHFFGSR